MYTTGIKQRTIVHSPRGTNRKRTTVDLGPGTSKSVIHNVLHVPLQGQFAQNVLEIVSVSDSVFTLAV